MKNTKLWIVVLVAMLVVIAVFSGCAKEESPVVDTDTTQQEEATLTISGLENGDITVTLSEIMAMDAYDGRVEGADSAGEPVEYDVKGAYFADLLEQNGYEQSDFAGMRIIASDGYSIEVGADILAARDVILGYEMDGASLDADNAPLRVFIPEERAMYWVRMVTGLEMSYADDPEQVSGVYFMNTLYGPDTYIDYEFIGQTYQAIDTKTVLEAYPGTKGDVVLMTAADGLAKNETLENFYKGAINMSGEESPEFFSSTLPSGMFVKNMRLFKYGGNAFYFVPDETQTLADITDVCMLESANTYLVCLESDVNVTIASDDMAAWTVGIENGEVYIMEDGADKMWNPVAININN